jgi:hypothetical protein
MTVALRTRISAGKQSISRVPPRPSRPAHPRRGVLRDGPHRPPPVHRRAAVHGEVHGAVPRHRRRTPARADPRRTAGRRGQGQQGRAPPRHRGRHDRHRLQGKAGPSPPSPATTTSAAAIRTVADLLPRVHGRRPGHRPRSCRSPSTCRGTRHGGAYTAVRPAESRRTGAAGHRTARSTQPTVPGGRGHRRQPPAAAADMPCVRTHDLRGR